MAKLSWSVTRCFFVVIGMLIATSVHAQTVDSWNSVTFNRPTVDQWEASKQAALRNLISLQNHLGTSSNGLAWWDFLRASELTISLASLTPPTFGPIDLNDQDRTVSQEELDHRAQIDTISQSTRRLIGSHEGLEQSQMLRLRTSLKQLMLLDRLMIDASLKTGFEDRRNALIQKLETMPLNPDADWLKEISTIASWMEEYGQATHATAALRSRFTQPNVRFAITDDAISVATSRAIRETRPIDETDDGRRITGQAIAIGTAKMIPVGGRPEQTQVVFDGTIQSTMSGQEGPVSFGFFGTTWLHTEQPVVMTPQSFTLLPIRSNSTTDLRPTYIRTKRDGPIPRLIRNFASKEIDKSMPKAERALDQGAVERFNAGFMEDVTGEIAEAEAELQNELLASMDRRDVRPDDLHFIGDRSMLQIAMTINGGFGWGATSSPPPPPVQGADLVVQIHESAIDRMTQRMLAGEVIDDFPALIKASGMEMAPQSLDQLPDDAVVQFASDQPITVTMHDGLLSITLRGERFQFGRAKLVAMNATIRYHVSVVGGQLVFDLVGEPEVTPPPDRSSGRFFMQKNVLSRRLQRDLPQHTEIKSFDLPAPGDRLGHVHFQSIQLHNGWMTVVMRGDRN